MDILQDFVVLNHSLLNEDIFLSKLLEIIFSTLHIDLTTRKNIRNHIVIHNSWKSHSKLMK